MDNKIFDKKIERRGGIWSVDTFGPTVIAIKSTVPDYDELNRTILLIDSFDSIQSEQNKANAAFICKAVNNYDSLLEALKDAQKYLEYIINNTPTGEKRNVFTDANIRALAAIQKAEQ